MIHTHSTNGFDKRTVLYSGLLLLLTIGIAVVAIANSEFSAIGQMICLSVPFLIHVIVSIFVRNKASWMLGATAATIIGLIIFLTVVWIIIKNK